MKKIQAILIIPLIVLIPLISAAFLPTAHANPATGTVCLSTDGTNCASSIGGASATVGSSITVFVLIQGSDPLNGFDVLVKADHSLLAGTGISLTGSILGLSASIIDECLDGSLVAGPTCTPQDGVGVVHLSAGITGANVGGAGATTGKLFAITYSVAGSTTGTPVSFVTGCSGTSVSGTCVTITNGTGTPDSEMIQNSVFANVADYSIAISPHPIEALPGVAGSGTVTLTAKGTFSDFVQLSIDASSSITASITSPAGGLCDLSVPTCTATVSVGPAAGGTYLVVVDASGLSSGISHSANDKVLVSAPDFQISASPTAITVAKGGSGTSAINVTGISGFTDNVMLSAMTPAGVSASFGTNPVTGGTGIVTMTVLVSATGVGGAITVTGTDQGTAGAGPHATTVTLTIQSQTFTFQSVPGALSVPRGSSAVATLILSSVGNFAGTATFSASVTNQGTDSAGLTTNITPNFSPMTVALGPGATVQDNFFATTVKAGTSPSPTDTATGNYTITITATINGAPQQVSIALAVFDFSLGPTFCPGQTPIDTSPADTFAGPGVVNYSPVFVGAQCETLTITTQTVANGGSDGLGIGLESGTLWMQVNALGGLVTNGLNGNGIAGINSQLPGRGAATGVFVPELGFRVCLAQTFWGNGTQIKYSYLQAHGPIIAPGTGQWLSSGFNFGCRFDAGVYPHDIGAPNPVNNVDFFGVTAQSLSTTLPGTYFFNICALSGALMNCHRLTLIVVQAPNVHQLVFSNSVSLSAGGVQSFKLGISNVDPTTTIYAAVTATVTGSLGHTFSVTSAVVKINPNANSNNIALTLTLTPETKGETFSFSFFISIGLTPTSLTGVSTLATSGRSSGTFTVTA